ncbi:MAG TPA: cupin domain-containing protein [Acetobacteraceae bacterium]|nr:cupin domain-containing protein [Acetobacteraceae bacterium]
MIDLRDSSAPAEAVIEALALQPHPEGGHFRETWRDVPTDDQRGAGTAILFLLSEGQRSHWHRVDAAELWVWQAGAPLLLRIGADVEHRLGPMLGRGETLQQLVPRDCWQSARSLGQWTLCSCVVAPAFSFDGFELAPPDWHPWQSSEFQSP